MRYDDKEPYIKEKSMDKLEDTNSYIVKEEMLVDNSNSRLKRYEEKLDAKLDFDLDEKEENFNDFEEVKMTREAYKEEKSEAALPRKKKVSKNAKLGSNLIVTALCFIPILIVLIVIGLHSNKFVSKPVFFICAALLIIFTIFLILGIILKKGRKVKSKLFKILFSIFMFFYIVGSGAGLFLLYGPMEGFKNWLIPTAMTTLHHQYFATWFYSDDTIQYVLDNNAVIESGEDTDLNLITIGNLNFDAKTYANEYEKAVLTKDPGNDIYKIIDVEGKGFKGHMVVVYDPSRVGVAVTKYLNVKGQYVTDMAADSKALVAINGGGFVDPNYSSSGGTPQGVVIKDGKVVSNRSYTRTGGIIGLTKDNKLILAKMSATEALNKGVRDAVSFGPFLIVNGKKSFIKGNGGWGTAPRTAIGQRKDGIILLLVVDGRKLNLPGADMVDLTDVMEKYGAYNAANLDGGTSSVMVLPQEKSKKYLTDKELKTHCRNNYCYINDPIDGGGSHETRWVATSIIVK